MKYITIIAALVLASFYSKQVISQSQIDTLTHAEYLMKYEKEFQGAEKWTGTYVILSSNGYQKGILLNGKKSGLWRTYRFSEEYRKYVLSYEHELIEDSILLEKRYFLDREQVMIKTQYNNIGPKTVKGYFDSGILKYESHNFNYIKFSDTEELQIQYHKNGQISFICNMKRYVTENNIATSKNIGNTYFFNRKGEVYLIEKYNLEGELLEKLEYPEYGNIREFGY